MTTQTTQTTIETLKTIFAGLAPLGMQETDYKARGFHLDIRVAPGQVTEAAALLDKEGFFLEAVTGVDWLGEKAAYKKEQDKARAEAAKKAAESAEPDAVAPPEPAKDETPDSAIDDLEAVYDFNHYQGLLRVVVRTRVPRDNPEIPTISGVFPAADWHERETHDFFGIRFAGHPDLSPLLLPEDADYHPLLKDFHV